MSNNKTHPNSTINPIVETSTDPYGGSRMECTQGGLTKREYFAAMAMQGLLSNPNKHFFDADGISNQSIKMADTLIKELNNEQQ